MTQREYEEQRYLILAGVDEAFKSLQVLATDLKNAEDTGKNSVTLVKMKDAITDINRLYGEYEELSHEEITEEPVETGFEFEDNFNCNNYADGFLK